MYYRDIEKIEKYLTDIFKEELNNSKIIIYLYKIENKYLLKTCIIGDISKPIDLETEEVVMKELKHYLKEMCGFKCKQHNDSHNEIEVSKKDMENYLTLIKMKGV